MKKMISFACVVISIVAIANYLIPASGQAGVIEDSIFEMVRKFISQGEFEPVDLAIEEVKVTKVSDPTGNSNYYKYLADITFYNEGGSLRSANVVLTNSSKEKDFPVKNTADAFSLRHGELFTLRNYELQFDGRYNGGRVDIDVQIADKADTDLSNNSYEIELFELPSKLASFKVDEILESGELALKVASHGFIKSRHDFEVFTSTDEKFEDYQLTYTEVEDGEDVYGYYRVENSEEIINHRGWESKDSSYLAATFFDFNDFTSKEEGGVSLFIKVTDPVTDYYLISDVIYFPIQEGLNRAEYSKLLVDQAGIDLFDIGDVYYNDVDEEEWYFPYAQTLYNLGLTDLGANYFLPGQQVTRAEVIKAVINYFDVDLATRARDVRFDDVLEEDEIYPYAQALYASGVTVNLAETLRPGAAATRNFLKFMVNEYRQSN